MLYETYQVHADLLSPSQLVARTAASYLGHGWMNWSPLPSARKWAANWELFSRIRLTHHRPDFGITSVQVGEQWLPVREEVVHRTPFATLLRFAREGAPADQPRVLVAAPLSGHFATLLRDTVRTLLADHDVYITDWHNARHVPCSDGPFGLDEYIEHLIGFMHRIGAGSHVLAVCQPCVPVLAAVAVMAEDDDPAQPLSMTLMAGPVDTRVNPTAVNDLANSKTIEWFDLNLVHSVPARFAGAGRRVYPGFLQLAAFMGMNPERHRKAFADLHAHIVAGETEKADATRAFYDEYFAVNDLTAEFYLQTVRLVFQEHALPLGELRYRGRRVRPEAIRRTALLTVEGERDDICAIGQTVAAHDLCRHLAPWRKHHHVQLGVGHYGVFSGRRWQQQIYPRVRELVHSMHD